MDILSDTDFKTHVTILGWVMILANAALLLLGLLFFLFFSGIGALVAVEDPIAPRILVVVGTIALITIGVLSLPGIIAGAGLLRRQTWARYLALVVSFLGLMNIPVGTIMGIYGIFVLIQRPAERYFRESM